MSGVPASDSLDSVSSGGTGDADAPASHGRGPLVADLVGRIAAFPLVLGSTAQPSRDAILDRFTDFSRFIACLSPYFFHFSGGKKASSASAIEQLPREIKESGRKAPAGGSHATLMPRRVHLTANRRFSRIFHDEKKNFSRWLLALSGNLALVNDEQFCSTCNLGETR